MYILRKTNLLIEMLIEILVRLKHYDYYFIIIIYTDN